MPRTELSIVVAVYNEEEVLGELHRRLTNALRLLGRTYEIILVDDGSRDRSLEIMLDLERQDPEHLRVLSFTRNFGHHIALTAGLDHAMGEIVVMMDADLQDQPEELHKLLEKLDEGYDVVWGDREERQFSWYKNLTSRLFLWTMNSVVKSEVPLNSSIYRAMRKPVADDLRQLREKARFLPGLVTWLGYRQTSTPVVHGKRFAGETKYSVWRLLKLALSTATSFSAAPLQLATIIGMSTAVLALFVLIYIVVRKLLGGYHVLGYASIMFAVLFFGALQLIVIGLMGEYISRIYGEAQGRPLYLLRDLQPASSPRARLVEPTQPQRLSASTAAVQQQLRESIDAEQHLPLSNVFANRSALARQHADRLLSSDGYLFSATKGSSTAHVVLNDLEWDTQLLGTRAARLSFAGATGRGVESDRVFALTEALRQMTGFARSRGIELIDARVSNSDLFLMRAFEAAGFHTVDVLATLGARRDRFSKVLRTLDYEQQGSYLCFANGVAIREMRPEDEEALAQLSFEAFGEHDMIQDRFFLEPAIDRTRAQELFREWFRNLARGQHAGAGAVLVAEVDGVLAGYIGLERAEGPDGELVWKDSLNAVAPFARGKGVYKALVVSAFDLATRTGAEILFTKTQTSTYRVINTWLHMGCDLYENFATLHWTAQPSEPGAIINP